MTAASADDWGSSTAHPTTSELELRLARQRAMTSLQRETQKHDATTRQPVEVEARHMLDPEVARGFPMFDGKRGMPGGCVISGTRPGDKASKLERDNRYLAARERARNTESE